MPTESVACPICGRPLKSMGAHWLSAFECEKCGQFTDFSAPSSPAQRRHPVRLPEPPVPDSREPDN
jgi:tRNA(Ile2) C34 agmatinyltransferase TiaS